MQDVEPTQHVVDESQVFDEQMEEVTDMVTLLDALKEEERFYPVNRAARRKAEKRNRALQKRDPRG